MESPTGKLLLAADEAGLRTILFADGHEPATPRPHWREGLTPLRETIRQLRAWFAGELREFQLPLAPEGAAFYQRVWCELRNIPYGETISYGELARRIGSPNASRAVGRANGANPIPIVIPCHRVIGSNGKLTGYGGGLPRKEFLLALSTNRCCFHGPLAPRLRMGLQHRLAFVRH
jgi:methylated-DNA-[protein]-cysteine S-methyltransferase